MICTAQKPFQ